MSRLRTAMRAFFQTLSHRFMGRRVMECDETVRFLEFMEDVRRRERLDRGCGSDEEFAIYLALEEHLSECSLCRADLDIYRHLEELAPQVEREIAAEAADLAGLAAIDGETIQSARKEPLDSAGPSTSTSAPCDGEQFKRKQGPDFGVYHKMSKANPSPRLIWANWTQRRWIALCTCGLLLVTILGYAGLGYAAAQVRERKEQTRQLYEHGRYEEAFTAVNDELRRQPSAEGYKMRGDLNNLRLHVRNYDAAIRDYSSALQMLQDSQTNSQLYFHTVYNRGLAYERIGDLNRAERDFIEAATRCPEADVVAKAKDNLHIISILRQEPD